MRVCLVGVPTANEFDDRSMDEANALRTIAEHAPLGVLSLAAVLEERGLRPEVVDLNRLYYNFRHMNGQNENDFSRFAASYFPEHQFDFVGFGSVCSSYPLTLRIACEVKRRLPESVVAFGGPQASAVDVATLQAYPRIDLVLRGEAEQTLPQLLQAIDQGGPLDEVPGLTFRRGGKILRNPDAAGITDLDSLPFPAFHLLPDMETCRFMPLELGRGCPFACTFCSTNDFFRRRFRLKSPARMLEDMRRVKATYGIDTFELVHDMFTVDRKRVAAFCEALLASPDKFYWGCSARTDCIDEELIELMASAGCRGVFFGIETGSARMQKIIDKRLDLTDSVARVRACDKAKIKTAVSLIVGFPEETREDLRSTVGFFLDSLQYDHADPQLVILAPLAGTPIHQQHKENLYLEGEDSDMAYRGWDQGPEERTMIAEHQDIFPNFYSVPTPHLDQEFVKELRDFLLNGIRVMRRLLVDLHQGTGKVFEVFMEWRKWRTNRKGPFSRDDRAAYYASGSFPRDFLEFLEAQITPADCEAPGAGAAPEGNDGALTYS
ncbi:MAG TPA: radical SAM protein [Verrucomicrobiae bacterium]|jgi:radical SAM superfamily enzyme YgiQ (UPF0313 family)|nr:radical SAM protein [Verrucomicrobiae bacterium]